MRETDVEVAIRAVEAGAGVVRAMYGGRMERFAKSGDDFATEADVAAERTIMAVLREARPADGFLGEEGGDLGQAASGRRWLVDPLCGTLNYAARTPLVAVNVALRACDRVSTAAVADPLSHEVFWTDGEAASVRSDERDTPLRPDPTSRLVDLNLDPPFPNKDWFLAADLLIDEGFTSVFHPRVLSTTLALAWVAVGRRAAYITDGRLRDNVHFSSGIALCQAAGCVVTNLAGQPVHTGVQGLIAAADATTHAKLLDLLSHRRQPRTP
ncbi:inositol monophosphatase family protein [Actinokineospora spheciospongiae]|uniref:inositol monophosphatase family protein n=1 Tax=Actinokineospora spheciospongiae TaxID=909613 RepID=UPI000D7131CD|nr:inositol monophosphatase family protein [Actinokineospora spheciospongiae]PWW63454.1 myo-inositol-1(or 4)-monophosphatase [Actinokineospora spheciospongiae]